MLSLTSNLSQEKKTERHVKMQKFFAFIDYDWGDERAGKQADWKTGTKQWQIYKEVHGWHEVTDGERQLMKRKFYQENVDKDFEHDFLYKSEEEKQDFMLYCTLYTALGEIGFPQLQSSGNPINNSKRILYLMFLVFQPMNVPYSWSLFFFAAVLSLLQKSGIIKEETKISKNLLSCISEEECLNLFLMVFLIPSGP